MPDTLLEMSLPRISLRRQPSSGSAIVGK